MAFKDEFSGLEEKNFPNLKPGTYLKTSPKDKWYNCVAWTLGLTEGHWWPFEGYQWPEGIRSDESIASFKELYATRGFVQCEDGSFEAGWQKVAIFATDIPTHVALQLPTGRWTSKLGGRDEDIAHDLEAVCGPMYGEPRCFMKREEPRFG